MPKRRRYDLRKRHFLNPLPMGHDSYISVAFESCENGAYPWGTNMVVIADCHRVINLEFFMGTPAARQASLSKIDGLLDTLTAVKTTLYKQNELIKKARKVRR
jgi:hypothetical protein